MPLQKKKKKKKRTFAAYGKTPPLQHANPAPRTPHLHSNGLLPATAAATSGE
jgi:hypothetical protein